MRTIYNSVYGARILYHQMDGAMMVVIQQGVSLEARQGASIGVIRRDVYRAVGPVLSSVIGQVYLQEKDKMEMRKCI